MSIYVPEGAAMPKGIGIDETSAYFGITNSSELLLELDSMQRAVALSTVLEKISDLLLTDSFDLDSGSERLNVETGEIYYILSGPLKLLDVTAELREFLGLDDEESKPQVDISEEVFTELEALLDPIELLRIYAVGNVVGGTAESRKYVFNLEAMLQAPAENIETLVAIRKQMQQILSETVQRSMPRAIDILAQSPAPASAPVPVPVATAIQAATPTQIPATSSPLTQQASPLVKPEAVPKPIRAEPASAGSSSSGLTEAQPLQRPVEATPPPRPAELDKRGASAFEAHAISTDNWMEVAAETGAAEPSEATPAPTPVETASTEQATIPPRSGPGTMNLPKPVRPSSTLQSDADTSNGSVARTFPQGNLCAGCGVSQSGSWRYCPLCGQSA